MIVLKSSTELAIMREAGRINAEVLERVRDAVRPGITTAELNNIAQQAQHDLNAEPVFFGYRIGNAPPFPGIITVCVNEELVHGIPGPRRLEEGDLLSVDCGSLYKGYIGDSAFSVGVGAVEPEVQNLIATTERALEVGIEQCCADRRVGDISAAIQQYVEGQGYNVVRGYGGHGVGRTMHEEPHIPNHGRAGRGMRLRAGMTIAIEPMVLAGDHDVMTLPDQWTVVSRDGRLTAHCEHTVAITDNGPEILTLL